MIVYIEAMDSLAVKEDDLTSNLTISKDNTNEFDVDSWFLMQHTWPIVVIISSYLAFVLHIGPAIMKHRKPIQIKNYLLMYNSVMIFFNLWLIFKAVAEVQLSTNLSCLPNSSNDQERIKVNMLTWYYSMSKFVELLDTVFFVLRKKQNQVSFLHVYHHTNMAVFTWVFLKYVRGDQILMIGIVNSAIHVVMYSYYFISAFGTGTIFNRILKFKHLITWMQMAQFVFLILYLVQLLVFNCDFSRKFTQFAIVNTFSFLLLFINFYVQNYSIQRFKVD